MKPVNWKTMKAISCINSPCTAQIPSHQFLCATCGKFNGYPNVREAEDPEERSALLDRYQVAHIDADARGAKQALEAFEREIQASAAVMSKGYKRAFALFTSSEVFQTFYQEVRSFSRTPEDNIWDRRRESADSLLFPYYHDQIHFAALTLTDSGVSHFGEVAMRFKDYAIRDRATVFEKNSRIFVDELELWKNDFPRGVRSTWEERAKLATAKLASRLSVDSDGPDFQELVVEPSASDSADIIEVHIHAPLSREAVDHVVCGTLRDKRQRTLRKALMLELATLRISFSTI